MGKASGDGGTLPPFDLTSMKCINGKSYEVIKFYYCFFLFFPDRCTNGKPKIFVGEGIRSEISLLLATTWSANESSGAIG